MRRARADITARMQIEYLFCVGMTMSTIANTIITNTTIINTTATIDRFIMEHHNLLISMGISARAGHSLLIPQQCGVFDTCDHCQSTGGIAVRSYIHDRDDLSLCFKCARLFIKRQIALMPRWLFYQQVNNAMNELVIIGNRYRYKTRHSICDNCMREYTGRVYSDEFGMCDECILCGTASYFTSRLAYLHRLQVLPVDVCYYIIDMLFDHSAFYNSKIELNLQRWELQHQEAHIAMNRLTITLRDL